MVRSPSFAALALPVSLAAGALALSACATVAGAVEENYTAALTGPAEVPGPGDADGTGTAKVSIVDELDNVCFELTAANIGTPNAAHIHRGAASVSGPPVVTLQPPVDGSSSGCVEAGGAVADEIKTNPSAFYVNVHTAEHPAGAIRGQLNR